MKGDREEDEDKEEGEEGEEEEEEEEDVGLANRMAYEAVLKAAAAQRAHLGPVVDGYGGNPAGFGYGAMNPFMGGLGPSAGAGFPYFGAHPMMDAASAGGPRDNTAAIAAAAAAAATNPMLMYQRELYAQMVAANAARQIRPPPAHSFPSLAAAAAAAAANTHRHGHGRATDYSTAATAALANNPYMLAVAAAAASRATAGSSRPGSVSDSNQRSVSAVSGANRTNTDMIDEEMVRRGREAEASLKRKIMLELELKTKEAEEDIVTKFSRKNQAKKKRRRNLCLCEQIRDHAFVPGYCAIVEHQHGSDHWLHGAMYSLPKEGTERGGVNVRARWLHYLGGITEAQLKAKCVHRPEIRWTHFPVEHFNTETTERRRLKYTVEITERTDLRDICITGRHKGQAIPMPCLDFTRETLGDLDPAKLKLQAVERLKQRNAERKLQELEGKSSTVKIEGQYPDAAASASSSSIVASEDNVEGENDSQAIEKRPTKGRSKPNITELDNGHPETNNPNNDAEESADDQSDP